ncbi:MAG: hypothetical protein ACUVV0_09795 [Anaerolineae bacterium]
MEKEEIKQEKITVLDLSRERPVSSLTVGELSELIRELLRKEREYYLDEEGYLVFSSEEAYAAYLEKQGGKFPSEVKAYFIDEQGYKCYYSDWELILERAEELKEVERGIAEGKMRDFNEVMKEMGLERPPNV